MSSYQTSSKYWSSNLNPKNDGVVNNNHVPSPLPPLPPLSSRTPQQPQPPPRPSLTNLQKYGDLIDGGFDPEQDNVYTLFTEYFNNPRLVKKKDVDTFSMYITKINSMLNNEYRYLILLVLKDNQPIGKIDEMKNLNWISLQTRTFEENQNILTHYYQPRRFAPLMKKIHLQDKNENSFTYTTEELPLIITLLTKKMILTNIIRPV